MEIKSFDAIYNDMRNYIIAHQDKLTDFNEGSVLTSQIEAFAREISMLYISCHVGFSSFLRSLPYSVFGFPMKEGTKASVDVVFSRSKPFPNDTAIPAGTVVSGGGLKFSTTKAGTIPASASDSVPIPAIAEAAGDKYNTPAGTIKSIVSLLPADIVSVNNADAATGGEDVEDWAAYTGRFADYIIGLQRTNNTGILSGLNSRHLVRSHYIQEHFPPLDGIWNISLYLEDGSGGMTGEALAEAKRIIDGNTNQNIGGYRAPGVNIRYLTPEIKPVVFHVTVTAKKEFISNEDESVIANHVVDAIRKYINGLKIGEPVLLSDLVVVLKRQPELNNVQPTFPAEDIILQPNEIARFENCVVTVII